MGIIICILTFPLWFPVLCILCIVAPPLVPLFIANVLWRMMGKPK